MKTTEFIVEYAGIGGDADAMGADHEVQLARQDLYNAAKDAIALYHLLKSVSEREGLEGWVSEKITLAADYLKSVQDYYQEQTQPDIDMLDAFSFESAEALYTEMLAESYVGRETKAGTWRVFKTGQTAAVAGPFSSAEEASDWIKKQNSNKTGVAESDLTELSKNTLGSYADKASVKAKGLIDKANDQGYGDESNATYSKAYKHLKGIEKANSKRDATVTELDASTMQAYLSKRKSSTTPGTVHKAGVQAAGVRTAREKIHDKQVTAAAKRTGRLPEAQNTDLPPSHAQSEENVAKRRASGPKNALGQALYRDLSKEKKASPTQVEKNKARWATSPANPANKATVKENASAGATGAGAMATGVAGATAHKAGTGKPKAVGNKVSRKQVQVGKGIY